MAKEKNKPDNVSTALILLWIMLAIGVINSIFTLSSSLKLANTSDLDSGFLIGVLIFTLCFTLLFMAFFIWKIGQGKNWARITYLVLFILGVPFTIYSYLTSAVSTLLIILMIGQIILQIIALVLLFQKQSSDWFKSKLSMTEKKVKTHWYKRWWAITLFIIIVLIILSNIYSNLYPSKEESVKNALKEDNYEVLSVIATDMGASLEMKALGNRDEQVWAGINALTDAYPDAKDYYVDILTDTQTCTYSTVLTNYNSYKKLIGNDTLLREVDFEFKDVTTPLQHDGTLDGLNFAQVLTYINKKYNMNFALTGSRVDMITLYGVVKYQVSESQICS